MNKAKRKPKEPEYNLQEHIQGRLIIAIGAGDFAAVLNGYIRDVYERGFRAGRKAK